MIGDQLESEVEELRRSGYSVNLIDGNPLLLIITDYPLPNGYSQTTTNLLLKIPPSYPHGKIDMFWTDKELRLENGAIPNRAEVVEGYCEKEWRRFSWHPKDWNPGRNNLTMYLEFVNNRLNKRQ